MCERKATIKTGYRLIDSVATSLESLITEQSEISSQDWIYYFKLIDAQGKFMLLFQKTHREYRKVESSRPVYYSIFDHFWGATIWDVLLIDG